MVAMKHYLPLHFSSYYALLLLALCSCTGCDIDRTQLEINKANPQVQLVDLTTGKCLVNEIEAEVSARHKHQLMSLLSKHLEDIIKDSVVHLNSALSHFKGKIPFDIGPELLDTLRRTTSYTYLLSVRALKMGNYDDRVGVDMIIYDLDTRNIIYNQSVVANEFQPEDDAGFTFYFGRSNYNLVKNALLSALRDLKKGARKFNRSQAKGN